MTKCNVVKCGRLSYLRPLADDRFFCCLETQLIESELQ